MKNGGELGGGGEGGSGESQRKRDIRTLNFSGGVMNNHALSQVFESLYRDCVFTYKLRSRTCLGR